MSSAPLSRFRKPSKLRIFWKSSLIVGPEDSLGIPIQSGVFSDIVLLLVRQNSINRFSGKWLVVLICLALLKNLLLECALFLRRAIVGFISVSILVALTRKRSDIQYPRQIWVIQVDLYVQKVLHPWPSGALDRIPRLALSFFCLKPENHSLIKFYKTRIYKLKIKI